MDLGRCMFHRWPSGTKGRKNGCLSSRALTGLAQISGRGELTREEKLELDVKYVETAGFWLDLKIILATIARVFGRKNIYEKKYSQAEYTRGEGGKK